ncbi:DUF1064 domain-containing protein [Clostridium sp. JN-1]|uniref:DUF1064 domain-containing protein n=1 Tax=Clostridium sp. JN-1 TaxID=2483110 RepID=UPI000F0B03EC|nr:DUF1064 domain-containing protein [Clostridium sp. JN-1]
MNWTQEEYDEFLKRRGQAAEKPKIKVQKYRNKGVWYDGLYFRSQLECQRYCQLKLLFNAGEIAGFILQPEFVLQEGNGENKAITYTADFLILNNDGTYDVEDTKGYESQQWKRTYKQFKLRYPKVDLKILREV